MKRCTLDKIASVTHRSRLSKNVVLGTRIPATEGSIVACRVLNAKTSYNHLEDVNGRMVALHPGDIIAGALGHRDALHGYSGQVPETVEPGDELQLLNLGGVLGTGARATPGQGDPFRMEVLGSILSFPSGDRRHGQPASVSDGALASPVEIPPSDSLPPVIALVGTSMNSGKTTAACALIAAIRRTGRTVAAGKLTGISLRRDVLEMADSGADPTALFTDFGVVTTDENNAPPSARALLSHLAAADPAPGVIVLEMGDGLLGTYGVRALLADDFIRSSIDAIVLCANDPVGAWGAMTLLDQRFGLSPAVVSGPVTDSDAGRSFCRESLELPCWNALTDGGGIVDLVLKKSQPVKSLEVAV
jgi:hypothetical protein